MPRAPLLLVSALMAPAVASAAPPIQSPIMAVGRLRSAKTPAAAKAAVSAVVAACRGKLRHSLRDHPALLKQARTLSGAEDAGIRRAALDLDPCFSAAKFVPVLGPRLSDADPKVVTYAAEVAARLADPAVVPPLLARFDAKKAACLEPGLDAAQVEICVWLTYAPGAALERADKALRGEAATRAVAMFAAPYPKVREVAVETVASARLKAHAPAVKQLIADERAKKLPSPNDAALLKRFEKRYRALRKGE